MKAIFSNCTLVFFNLQRSLLLTRQISISFLIRTPRKEYISHIYHSQAGQAGSTAFDYNLPLHPLQSGDHRWLLALVPLPQVPQDGE